MTRTNRKLLDTYIHKEYGYNTILAKDAEEHFTCYCEGTVKSPLIEIIGFNSINVRPIFIRNSDKRIAKNVHTLGIINMEYNKSHYIVDDDNTQIYLSKKEGYYYNQSKQSDNAKIIILDEKFSNQDILKTQKEISRVFKEQIDYGNSYDNYLEFFRYNSLVYATSDTLDLINHNNSRSKEILNKLINKNDLSKFTKDFVDSIIQHYDCPDIDISSIVYVMKNTKYLELLNNILNNITLKENDSEFDFLYEYAASAARIAFMLTYDYHNNSQKLTDALKYLYIANDKDLDQTLIKFTM